MFYTLDRIENENVAVLIDDEGNKHDVDISILEGNTEIGSVYSFDGNHYIYNEKETASRRSSNSEKLRKLMSKAKNRK
ncbi:MAG: DUF3006 domain-containing protein [Clostridia bacterium]|nr:DUF3006 domain-containing protein [Clostridia bacterium]